MEIIYILTALLIGLIFGWVFKLLLSKSESSRLEERNKLLENINNETDIKLNAERERVLTLNSDLSSLQADFNNLQKKLAEQKGEVEELQEKFTK